MILEETLPLCASLRSAWLRPSARTGSARPAGSRLLEPARCPSIPLTSRRAPLETQSPATAAKFGLQPRHIKVENVDAGLYRYLPAGQLAQLATVTS